MKSKKTNLILSCLALGIGGFLYIITRPDSHIAIAADKIIPFTETRYYLRFLDNILIKYYVPDFLWAFSLTCALFTINGSKKQALLISITVAVGWEILQYLNLLKGTGDIVDIILYLTAIFIAVLINK